VFHRTSVGVDEAQGFRVEHEYHVERVVEDVLEALDVVSAFFCL